MTPSTTATTPGFTGSGLQTTTAGTAAAGTEASCSHNVKLSEATPRLPPQESSSWQPLLQRSVSSSFSYISLNKLAKDASLQNLPLDDRERVIAMILEVQREMDVYRNAIEPFLEMHRKANSTSDIVANKVFLGKLNRGLPALEFTAWPTTFNADRIISDLKSYNYLLEVIDEVCTRANITVRNQRDIYEKISAIFKNILTSKSEIKTLKNQSDEIKNELARLVHELTEETSRIQSLEKTLEDKTHKLQVSQDNAAEAIKELDNLKTTLECTSRDLDISESKVATAEKSIQEIKEQNKGTKRNLDLSQKALTDEKGKVQKLEETVEKQKLLIGSLQEKATKAASLESELTIYKKDIQKIKTGIAAISGCSETASLEELMKSVGTLKQSLEASEASFLGLYEEHKASIALEKKLRAANSNNKEKQEHLCNLLKDTEEALRLSQRPLGDKVSSVNADHSYSKRQETCATVSQPVSTREAIEKEAANTLLALSNQGSAVTAPELRALLQTKETADQDTANP